jgi:serine/threonine protein kinase
MAAPPPGLGLSIGRPAGLGLGIGRPSGLSLQANSPPALINPETHGLNANLKVSNSIPGVYSSNIRKILNSTDAVRGIRKIVSANNEGLYLETRREKGVLNVLRASPNFEQYVLPYKKGYSNAGSVYLNFNWKEGSDLFDYLESRLATLSVEEKRKLIVDIAKSLKWLAQHGFVHGDVKFQNLYRGTDGRIYLLDFGKAKRLNVADSKDVDKVISQFGEMIAPHLTPEAPEFQYDAYGADYAAAIVAFYDAMIRKFSPGGQGGGRRSRKTRRQSKKRRATHRLRS